MPSRFTSRSRTIADAAMAKSANPARRPERLAPPARMATRLVVERARPPRLPPPRMAAASRTRAGPTSRPTPPFTKGPTRAGEVFLGPPPRPERKRAARPCSSPVSPARRAVEAAAARFLTCSGAPKAARQEPRPRAYVDGVAVGTKTGRRRGAARHRGPSRRAAAPLLAAASR